MSIGASLLRGVYRLSGVKKAFALPEEQLLKAIEKANRGRGFFMPTDRKAHYEKRVVNGFPCLIVRVESKPSQRAILFFFGGGMVIGPDKGDAAVRGSCAMEQAATSGSPSIPSARSTASPSATTWPTPATGR